MKKYDGMIDSQMTAFKNNLSEVSKILAREVEQMIFDNLRVINGRFEISPDNMNNVLEIANDFINVLQESGYNDLISESLLSQREMIKVRLDEIRTGYIGQRLGSFDTDTLDSLLQMQHSELLNIGADALSKVKSVLIQQVTAGGSTAELSNVLSGLLDNKLSAYAETYLRTAKGIYQQTIENQIAEQVGFSGIWEYTPADLMDTSHEECIWAIEQKEHAPYFTTEEKAVFEAGVAYPGQPSPPRWNCRHKFLMTDLTEEEYLKE